MGVGLVHFNSSSGHGDNNSHGRPRFAADEELMHFETDVAIALEARPLESPGTLYISTKRVIWVSDVDVNKGYAVDFLSISLHAVCRDPEAYPWPCIYAQIDIEDDDMKSESSYSESSECANLLKVTEMRLVPSDPIQLETLFDIFSKCAELNPDPPEEREQENTWFYGDEEMVDNGHGFDWPILENLANPIGYAYATSDLTSSVCKLQIDDERFQDADGVAEDNLHDEHQRTAE